jgi:hypothetical protein
MTWPEAIVVVLSGVLFVVFVVAGARSTRG